MPRPIRAVVNTAAITSNVNKIKQLLGDCLLMPVVKANAYGHGLERVLPGLNDADALAILEVEGAARLRNLGWTKPIVLLEGCFDPLDLYKAVELKCDWVIHQSAQLDQLESLLQQSIQYKPRIFLKLNTGMNRLGFEWRNAPATIQWLDEFTIKHGWPTPVLMTHFANADEQEPQTRQPTAQAQHETLMRLKPVHWQSSLANSAAALNAPHLAGHIARPGIAIYGATPGPKTAIDYALKPAMRLESQIIAIQNVVKGDCVGYGSRWQADKDARIAVLACGYADGYPRHAPDGTPTFVEGQVSPLVGRVSMDMMTIDVSHIPSAKVGSVVELWGENIAVDEVAAHCGTIGYELLCAIAPRVPFDVL